MSLGNRTYTPSFVPLHRLVDQPLIPSLDERELDAPEEEYIPFEVIRFTPEEIVGLYSTGRQDRKWDFLETLADFIDEQVERGELTFASFVEARWPTGETCYHYLKTAGKCCPVAKRICCLLRGNDTSH